MKPNDFVVCALVSSSVKPPIPSFDVGCDVCGARIWVSHQAPLEPIRLCPACAQVQPDPCPLRESSAIMA